MGVTTSSFLQNAGAVCFWVMAWCCLRQGVRPSRQPQLSSIAGALMALGLLLVMGALVTEQVPLAEIGQDFCYVGIAVYLLREVAYLRFVMARMRGTAPTNVANGSSAPNSSDPKKPKLPGESAKPWWMPK